jgi:hypothetical protein
LLLLLLLLLLLHCLYVAVLSQYTVSEEIVCASLLAIDRVRQ